MTGGRDLPTVVVPDAWPDDEIGPVLQFVATTNGRLGCSVIALCDLVAVGSIRWWGGGDDDDDDPDNNAGLIGFLHVGEQWRRQGIANALLAAANAYAEHHDLARPRHSPVRSPEGAAWAAANGAEPAADVSDENGAWGPPVLPGVAPVLPPAVFGES
jgi:GNAT superfamily N-acetyltransferase